MTIATLEKFKTLFRIDGITSKEYTDHLTGEKPINIERLFKIKQDKVWFVSHHPSGTLNVNGNEFLENIPVAFINSSAYLFFKNPVETEKAHELLSSLMERIGIKGVKVPCENILPFFTGDVGGERLIDEVLDDLLAMKKNYSDVVAWTNTLPYNDAPPCVQGLLISHNGKDVPEECIPYLKACGSDVMSSFPKKVLAFHEKNTVPYDCKGEVLCSRCNKYLCNRRKYRPDGGYVSTMKFGKLKRYDAGKSVFYVWLINDDEVRFESENEIMQQSLFAKVCMRSLGVLPKKMNDSAWTEIVNCALKNLDVIPQQRIDKVLPDRLKHIILNAKSRVVVDTRLKYSKLVQGYVFINPATFTMTLDGLGFCAYVNANFKNILMESYEQFKKALRHLGFRCVKKYADGSQANVWYIRLSDFIPDEKEWSAFIRKVSEGTPWEDNIKAITEEDAEDVGLDIISDEEKQLIEQDAVCYIDTEKEKESVMLGGRNENA